MASGTNAVTMTVGGVTWTWAITPPNPPDESAGTVSRLPRGPKPSPLTAFNWEPSVDDYDPIGDVMSAYLRTADTSGPVK